MIQLSKCNSSNDIIIIFAYKIVIRLLSYTFLMNHILSSSCLTIYSCLIVHLFWCGVSFTQKQRGSCQHRCDRGALNAQTHRAKIPLSGVQSCSWNDTFAFGVGFNDSERVLWWEEEADLHLRLVGASAAVKLVNTGVHIAELSSQTTEKPQRGVHNHYLKSFKIKQNIR